MNQQNIQDADPQDFSKIANELGSLLRSGGTLGGVFNLTTQECEALYQMGYGLYKQGRYADAFKVFSQAVLYNHLEPRYLMGLAGSAQMIGRYQDALQHYSTATLIALNDPLPPFHAAECLIALGRLEDAAESLEMAILLAGNQHPSVTTRAQALLTPLRSTGS